MDILGRLFGSEKKVKVMRLFLFNPHEPFDEDVISERTQLHKNSVKKYVKILKDIEMIQKTDFTDSEGSEKKGWVLNSGFRHLDPLHHLLVQNNPVNKEKVAQQIAKVGEIQMLILSGLFLQEWNARVDIFVVGDKIDVKKLKQTIRDLESEIGRELTYTYFSTEEYKYRQNVYDKLIRDILDFPHEKVINNLEKVS